MTNHADSQQAMMAKREHARLTRLSEETRLALSRIKVRETTLVATHVGEELDAVRWDSQSLKTRIYALFADLEVRRDKERGELALAALKLEEVRAERGRAEAELVEIDRRIKGLGDAPALFEEALSRREGWLRENDSSAARALAALDLRRAGVLAEQRELQEAGAATVAAGEELLKLQSALRGAGRMGTLDLMGGGILTSAFKVSRLEKARHFVPGAQAALDRMRRECADVGISYQLEPLGAPGSGWFAEVLFDNLFTDWATQSRISTALDRVSGAARKVEAVLAYITKRRPALDAEIDAVRAQREGLVIPKSTSAPQA